MIPDIDTEWGCSSSKKKSKCVGDLIFKTFDGCMLNVEEELNRLEKEKNEIGRRKLEDQILRDLINSSTCALACKIRNLMNEIPIPEPVKPSQDIKIIGIEGYETYRIDDSSIGVRPKWISVKDRLPPDDEDVLVNARQNGIYTAHLTIRNDWICSCLCYEGSFLNNITHWMPLPEPPND